MPPSPQEPSPAGVPPVVPSPRPRRARGEENDFPRGWISVIDDEPSIRIALHKFLERRGYSIRQSADGQDALSILRASEDPPAAIVCDLQLPLMTGVQLYRAIAEERPELVPRFIFSSGDATSPDALWIQDATSAPLIEKPFELQQLVDLIERIPARIGAHEESPDAPR